MGKLLYARPIRTYTHLKVENSIITSFKRARPETEEKTLVLIVKPAPYETLISPTKLARYVLRGNMYYWVLEASIINFKITSTIKAI